MYHNDNHRNTYGAEGAPISRYELLDSDGQLTEVDGSGITGRAAQDIRDGKIVQIDAFIG